MQLRRSRSGWLTKLRASLRSNTGRLSGSIVIAAPVETVWDYVTDWGRQGEWIPATRVRVERRADDNEQIVAWTGIGPLGFTDPMHVTVWSPPHRCEVLHTGRVVRGLGVFECRPAGDGTVFTWSEAVEVPGGRLAPVLWAIATPGLRLSYAYALRRLRRRITAV